MVSVPMPAAAYSGRRWLVPIGVLLLAATVAAGVYRVLGVPHHHRAASAIHDEDEDERRAPLTPEQEQRLTVQRVGPRDFDQPLLVPGTLAFDEERSTPVFTPQEGIVRAILARPGDRVDAGQPLAEIESADLLEAESGLVAAASGKAKAAAARRQAEREAARAQRLYQAKAGSLKDQEEAEAELAEAVAEDEGADAELAAARRKLALIGIADADIDALLRSRAVDRSAVLRAPLAGLVVARKVSPGQFVRSEGDEPLFAVADPSRMWVMADVPETASARVLPGLDATVAVPALPGRSFRARLAWVGAALAEGSHRLPARLEVDNADGALKAGMAAEIRIAQPPRHSLAVPATAVVRGDGPPVVWVRTDRGRFQRREVSLGAEQDGAVEVLRGLADGEAVVVAGAVYLDQRAMR
jgi:cobalt-zinc-cadmium efflux system membrane fusion protein